MVYAYDQHISSSRCDELKIKTVRLPIQEHITDIRKAVMNVNVVFRMLIRWMVGCYLFRTHPHPHTHAHPAVCAWHRSARTGRRWCGSVYPHGCTRTAQTSCSESGRRRHATRHRTGLEAGGPATQVPWSAAMGTLLARVLARVLSLVLARVLGATVMQVQELVLAPQALAMLPATETVLSLPAVTL